VLAETQRETRPIAEGSGQKIAWTNGDVTREPPSNGTDGQNTLQRQTRTRQQTEIECTGGKRRQAAVGTGSSDLGRRWENNTAIIIIAMVDR
jgi:hypothetical protein